MQMTLYDIVYPLTPILLTIMGYMVYKKPQDIVSLMKSRQERWDFERDELQHQITTLREAAGRAEHDNNKLQNIVEVQSRHLESLISILRNDYPTAWKTIMSWGKIYHSAVKDGLAQGVIAADIFVGRSGLHSTHKDLDSFAEYGLVDHDREFQEVRILEKGHIIGQALAPLHVM